MKNKTIAMSLLHLVQRIEGQFADAIRRRGVGRALRQPVQPSSSFDYHERRGNLNDDVPPHIRVHCLVPPKGPTLASKPSGQDHRRFSGGRSDRAAGHSMGCH